MIPKREPTGNVKVGDKITARVAGVLEDGKLTLSLREKAYIQIGRDAEQIMKMLKDKGGKKTGGI